jgi:hypothetical protein
MVVGSAWIVGKPEAAFGIRKGSASKNFVINQSFVCALNYASSYLFLAARLEGLFAASCFN